jgi:hypothetical protein
MDIAGNEKLEAVAKEAAKAQGVMRESRRFAKLKSGQIMTIQKTNKKQWNQEWGKERHKAK